MRGRRVGELDDISRGGVRARRGTQTTADEHLHRTRITAALLDELGTARSSNHHSFTELICADVELGIHGVAHRQCRRGDGSFLLYRLSDSFFIGSSNSFTKMSREMK
ncbi:hypothetical protein F2Q70_00027094 [Brassica cretica]|uniref:Uncharacterized protein n=1 Tax=Brassica cretica TaxID=69181 RepID=A0A8S9L8F8_BRACR|nr:hypothetical protein F2Q70_00027094 [Brassica cretica]